MLPIHRDQPWTDRLLLLGVMTTGFAALPVVAGLDGFRWHLLHRPAPLIANSGLVLFTLGLGLKALTLRANPFAIAVLRGYSASPAGSA
jgi:hypothetical protein